MKKRTLIISIVTIILIILISVVAHYKLNYSNTLKNFKYDILIEEHRYEYEGVEPKDIPETGYATNYYYTVINSKKLEKYTVTYMDVWEVHNKKGDIDKVNIKIKSINKTELEQILNQYKKKTELSNLKNLLEKNIKERFKVNIEN